MLSIEVTASDGSASASQEFSLSVANVNDAPTAGQAIDHQSAMQGADFVFKVPANAFVDIDNDTLSYSAKLKDGSALPSWLALNSSTGEFSGTPSNADVVDMLSIEVTVSDGSASASQEFNLSVANVNDAPTVANPMVDQTASQGVAFAYTVPGSTFTDMDKDDVLTYTAKLANGAALPAWLHFDGGTFSGTPGGAGQWNIQLLATDIGGASVSDFFTLTAAAAPADPPPSEPPPTDPPPASGHTINGTKGNDRLYGTPGDDRINGGKGKDLLSGGAGDDALYYSQDGKWGSGSTRKNAFTGEKVSIAGKQGSYDVFHGGTGYDVLMGTSGSDAMLLDDSRSAHLQGGPRVVSVEKIDAGAGNDVIDLTSKRYAYGDVEIDGGSGNDVVWSSKGNDILRGGSGNDRLDAAAGNDYLEGGSGNDKLNGRAGVDLLQGGSGNDELTDTSGNGLLDGGSGNDTLTEGSGNSMLVGGKGNDHLYLGGGYDIIAFNRGDGRDVVSSGKGGNATLSLGGGIRYQDLSLRRSGNDLILETGGNERITFEKWYAGKRYQAVSRLQVMPEAMPVDSSGNSAMLDDKVESFDFKGLVAAFDSARRHQPGLSRWTLTNALAQFHLGDGSDSKALGGDLAYQYGVNSTLAGIAVNAAQGTAASSQFGKEAQTLHGQSELKDGLVKLS
jgi:Ca2+-binding RTX toxin-like protein